VVPDIVPALGAAFTVTAVAVLAVPQPLVTVYDTVAVPVESALTTPVEETDAIVAPLLHEPPPTELVSTVEPPGQSVPPPDIDPAVGVALTVTVVELLAVPQVPLTV
jgi:hypothetical protein